MLEDCIFEMTALLFVRVIIYTSHVKLEIENHSSFAMINRNIDHKIKKAM